MLQEIENTLSTLRVISSQHIPPSHLFKNRAIPKGIGEARVFHRHEALKNFLPDAEKFSLAWLHLEQGEEWLSYSKHFALAIIIYKGSAKLLGALEQTVQAGEVVLIPRHCRYGFIDIGLEGLSALEIKFDKNNFIATPIPNQHKYGHFELNHAGFMAHNKMLLQRVLKNPFFTMIRDDTFKDPDIRQRFLDAVQVCSDFFQHILFIRQATCHDKTYQGIFLEHLKEEFGHDELLADRNIKKIVKDPILHATSSWFCHQMLVLDNIEKAALVHLTLEVGGYYYHTWAKDRLNEDVKSNYYDIHAEADDVHPGMVAELLQGQPPETYKRLYQVIERGWSMIDAMTSRVAYLALQPDV